MDATGKPIEVTSESHVVPTVKDEVEPPLGLADPDNLWAAYDPERTRETLRRMAGSISQEGERIKALIYRGREEGTRPPDRPYARLARPRLNDPAKLAQDL